MNREILFRAKAINRDPDREYRTNYKNGDWVYGLVTTMYDDRFPNLPAEMKNTDGISGIDVDHRTIGEYTGLTDKNSTKIFERDIITFEDVCCEGGSGYEYPDEWAVEAMNRAEIIIRNGCVCFGKELFETSAYEDIHFYYPNLNEWFAECAEVIGNIHDNPELVET